MKKLYKVLFFAVSAILASCTTDAEDEDENDSFDAAKVCPLSGRGTFIDDRDGQVYKYTTIGNQVWMAENLKYEAEYSECFDRVKNKNNIWVDDFCDVYGRFYSLQIDGRYSENISDSLVNRICPKDWHVPSLKEWENLIISVGGFENETSSKRLRSKKYWLINEGSDDCEFSAIPSGAYIGKNDGVVFLYYNSLFLTSSSDSNGLISTIKISHVVSVFNNLPKMSIRCVKD